MMMPRRRANVGRDERADCDRGGGRYYYCEEYREGFRIIGHEAVQLLVAVCCLGSSASVEQMTTKKRIPP